MKVAIVGGGILGLTLAYRLGKLGHQIDLLEAEPRLGGLACAHDYGAFTWDRFYHCVLPQDTSLLGLLDELGLGGELRWTKTGTGYFAAGQFHNMSGNKDFLRFPLLTFWDKMRMGAAVVWATRIADPDQLYGISAEAWLTKLCGRRTYERFWQPLLRAKFGPFHDKVAAVFIYATLKRLFGARSATAGKESLGYVHGGYHAVLGRMAERLAAMGAVVRTSAAVKSITRTGAGCRVAWEEAGKAPAGGEFDQVVFTAPTRLARRVSAAEFHPHVDQVERENPTSTAYLGVACLTLSLDRPLTPYYVLNIGETSVELTGLIEMTNLIDPKTETGGQSLLYLPRYMDSESPGFQESDESLRDGMIERGLKRLYPQFDVKSIRYCGVHRARYVQPLPLVRGDGTAGAGPEAPLTMSRPFQIVNTSMMRCATLNNNEVVALVDRWIAANLPALAAPAK